MTLPIDPAEQPGVLNAGVPGEMAAPEVAEEETAATTVPQAEDPSVDSYEVRLATFEEMLPATRAFFKR